MRISVLSPAKLHKPHCSVSSQEIFAIIISGNRAWVLVMLGHESSGGIICYFLFLVSTVSNNCMAYNVALKGIFFREDPEIT
jgi:hypothetical protein